MSRHPLKDRHAKRWGRRTLGLSSGLALAMSLLLAQGPAPDPGTARAESAPARSLRAAPAAATADTGAVSPFAQSGPRNLIKRLQDTYISSTDDADHSQGHLLHVGTPDAGATKYRSFLQFDVSRLTGANINRAYLRMYNSFVAAPDCGQNSWYGVYRVTEPWNQSTITWANQPAVGEGIGSWFGVGHPNVADCEDQPDRYLPDESKGIVRVDVTDMVKGWTRAGTTTPNYGIRLSGREGAPDAATGVTGYHDFCSMHPTGATQDRACTKSYFTPTLEVEFNAGSTPLITGNEYGPPYAGGYPAAEETLEFLDSANPSVWEASKPYQRWLPDAYHSVEDVTLKGANWKGGTSHKLRPGGSYGSGKVLVTGDGGSGFIGVVPYPALSGYHWAINVKGANEPGDLHGVDLLPDGSVVAAFAGADGVPGKVELYTKEQGQPGDWSGTPVQTIPLNSAHEVVADANGRDVWVLGGLELRKLTYDPATKRFANTTGTSYPLPKNPKGEGAWGHDLTPVYGNPDRFWVGANAGVVQFSKSGAADCHSDTYAKWPTLAAVQEIPNGANRWCTDYGNGLANSRIMLNSVGSDPVSQRVATTCSKDCGLANIGSDGKPTYTTSWIEIAGRTAGKEQYRWSENSKHYKVTWAVAAYN
ncbi:hypothetical protein GCM10017778_72340 [Streptomyces vinaceus]|nr:hypothetical protein GCM10017778_72340 [Streptomyces vinaceus]